MLTKIDYLSFSVIMNPSKMTTEQDAPQELIRNLANLDLELSEWLNLSDTFEPGNGRRPYRTSWLRADHGLTVMTHPDLEHALIEITGRGCDRLQSQGTLERVLAATKSRLTRIDLACDIATATRPREFVEAGYSGRIQARNFVEYPSGETYYVGSSKSARYCAVYRYNEPHERSALLRVEYRVKAEDARSVASSILAEGLRPVVAAFGQTFGWRHTDWEMLGDQAEISVYRPERKEGKTLYWLNQTIAPLLARLHGEGVMDFWQWTNEQVAPKLRDREQLKRHP